MNPLRVAMVSLTGSLRMTAAWEVYIYRGFHIVLLYFLWTRVHSGWSRRINIFPAALQVWTEQRWKGAKMTKIVVWWSILKRRSAKSPIFHSSQEANHGQIAFPLRGFNKIPHKLVQGYRTPHQNDKIIAARAICWCKKDSEKRAKRLCVSIPHASLYI